MSHKPKQNRTFEQGSAGTPWPDQIWIDHVTGEQKIRPPRQEKYIYGNPEVPVALYRDLIIDTVMNHPMTVLASAPGNGKSIFNKQFFYESGRVRRVYQTQPRVMATRENAQYARFLMEQATGEDHSHILGYRTANEGDHIKSTHLIREHTDGYTLQQLLSKNSDHFTKDDLLIIDEAHERNPNIDIALAVALKKGIRILVQSASIDTEKFARYGSRLLDGADVPILDIPGTMYPVHQINGGEMHEEIVKYARMGTENLLGVDGPLNIAALLPGAHERADIHSRIAKRIGRYTILHLHGDQSIEEQNKTLASYDNGKIVLANGPVLRQSITIPDLHVVLDGGYHKNNDFHAGVRYLRTMAVSRAAIIQGMGRVGRTGPGIYGHASLEGYPPLPRDTNGELLVDDYESAPIQRVDPLSYYLKLLANDESFESIDLMDMPRQDNIEHARRQAVRIGAVELHPDRLTEIGRQMMELSSFDPMYARMIVEARKYGKDIELQTAAMVAACQQEGITMTEQNSERWRRLTKEKRSDMLVQLDVLVQGIWMNRADLERHNIVAQRLGRAENLLKRFCKERGLFIRDLKLPDAEQREQIIACIITGCDTLFTPRNDGRNFNSNEGFEGRLPKSTNLNGHNSLVIGTPFVLEHYRNKTLKAHRMIKNATFVTAKQLEEHAPWRCQYEDDQYHVDEKGKVHKSFSVYFDGKILYERVKTDPEPTVETTRALIDRLFLDSTPFKNASHDMQQIANEAARLHNLLIDRSNNREYLDHIMDTITTYNVSKWGDIKVKEMFQLAYELRKRRVNNWLENTLSPESHEAQEILRNSPDSIHVDMEGEVYEVGVTYRDNKAILDIALAQAKYLNHDEVVDTLNDGYENRRVYIWTDNSRKNVLTLHNAIEISKRGNRAARRMPVKSTSKRRPHRRQGKR